jgi:uncharacterized membrane protein
LLSGTFAIAVRKGSRQHRSSGNVFTLAMLTLASSGLCLAILKSQHGNIIGSIVTFYMITTAWLAGRRRQLDKYDRAALHVGLGGAAAAIALGVQTVHHPDKNAPAGMCFFFGASSCSPSPETSVCSLEAESPADSASRVTSGARALDSLLPQARSS